MEEKTEEPTPKKLRDEREKGNVATSKEVVSAVVLTAVIGVAFVISDSFYRTITDLIWYATSLMIVDFEFALKALLDRSLLVTFFLLIPFVVALIVFGVAANIIQHGFIFSWESVKPELSKLSLVSGFKRIVCLKNLVEFLKSLAKIVIVGSLISYVIVAHLEDLIYLVNCGISCIRILIGELFLRVFSIIAICFILVGVLDFIFELKDHAKKLRMSPDEVKREHKDVEGNPEIKSGRKKFHQELLNGNARSRVGKSSVVVTNPTRLAIGLSYDSNRAPLPIVTIKGAGNFAALIRREARAQKIPIVEDKMLARALMREVEELDFVPSGLLQAVAVILRHVRETSVEAKLEIERG